MHASELSPEYPLLGLLAQKPSHGYDLYQSLQEQLPGIWRLSQSQCYNILKRLESQGDIHAEHQPQKTAPAKRILKLTPAGRQRFEQWLSTPTPASARAIRIEFITRLYFASLKSRQYALQLIDQQKIFLEKDMHRLQKLYEQIPTTQRLNQLSMQLRIKQLKSCIAWLQDCQQFISR